AGSTRYSSRSSFRSTIAKFSRNSVAGWTRTKSCGLGRLTGTVVNNFLTPAVSMNAGLRRKLPRSQGAAGELGVCVPSAAGLGWSVSSTGGVSSNLGLDMGGAFLHGVVVDKAQRSHAISANAYLSISDGDVPAVPPVLEHGDELAAVVDAEPEDAHRDYFFFLACSFHVSSISTYFGSVRL